MTDNDRSSRFSGLDTILVATDLSGRSEKAFARGLDLAARGGARIKLVHVVDDDQPLDLVENEVSKTFEFLSGVAGSKAKEAGVDCEVKVLRGLPSEAIKQAADEVNADLLVLGAHRRQFLRDVFTGTTVERVIRTSGRPVLMVKTDESVSYRRVLAAVDLSVHSLQAFDFAAGVSFLGCRHLTLVHAFTPLADGLMRYADVEKAKIEEYVQSLADEAHTAILNMLKTKDLSHLKPDIAVEEGYAEDVIKRVIGKVGPQLVVLGTRGNSSMKSLLIGSVANAILRDVECDVLAYAGI